MGTAAQGEARSRAWRLWITSGPGLFWIVLFLLIPSGVMLGIAFFTNSDFGSPVLPLSLDSFSQVAGYGILGWSGANFTVLLRSLLQAGVATSVTILLAYPLVFFIVTRPANMRPVLLLFAIVPSWTNQVVRTYAWMELLNPFAPVSHVAQVLGIIPPHLGLMPGDFAVLVGLSYNYLPYMVVPLYAAAEKLDWTLVEAGRDLYASGAKLFFNTVFPQTLPGLLSGIILVGIPAFGDYVVPQLLGGDKAMMLGSLIADQFTFSPDWPYGAALTLIMLAFTCIGLIVFRRLTQRLGGGEGAML
ncbi:spermidine/putrescine ABC transporter permease [Acidocella aquatica]|uniref:Spermidine/putrescine ABC transporter permease n=1 Tax=Acidocella aquatica TaxID=1922313 RepID=A0ABQ6ABK5_9PROT|nr:ABC transporter permease [Acidocella aquatica]GLR67484.1 spermidine/putrescine ABC transporter permease [Acidocella aquatica]